MTTESHTSSAVDKFLKNDIVSGTGLELTQVDKKVSVVLEEEETTYIYSFRKAGSEVLVNVAVSDPLYFCDVTFAKSADDYFSLKPYLATMGQASEMESLFDFYMDEKISDEEYVLGYLNLFKKSLGESDVQSVVAGEFWPDVPSEE
jgi:hypothetical protein